jgi:SGNH domain (fused to AT3 domains)
MTGRDAPDINITKAEYDARHAVVMAAFKDARACGVHVLDTPARLCTDGLCHGSINHEPLYFDDDHLNEDGNRKLVPLFKEIFR